MWGGHFLATETMRLYGVLGKGGLLRFGLAHYNTGDEVDALLAALSDVLA